MVKSISRFDPGRGNTGITSRLPGLLAGVAMAICMASPSVADASAAKTADRILPDATARMGPPAQTLALVEEASGSDALGRCDRGDIPPDAPTAPPMGLPPGPPPPNGRMGLAMVLTAAETYIGIEPNQRDAWRAFTTALIAMAPSGPPPRPAHGETKAPFARTIALAQRMVEHGKAAEAVLTATEQLKAKLSPVQLARVAELGPLVPPPGPPPPPGRPPGFAPLGAPPQPRP
ncbi:MAG: hypothetical protein B7Z15_01780 [Rhizobiales bacterium 32-66-8]|nr:MAG: hypothetical protein B7Z15_01780 [Rhizobiales bacterium 32-66-8]